jgi:hypothetical protein
MTSADHGKPVAGGRGGRVDGILDWAMVDDDEEDDQYDQWYNQCDQYRLERGAVPTTAMPYHLLDLLVSKEVICSHFPFIEL